VPGVEQSESTSVAAGTSESTAYATINPPAHGQTNAYDLGMDLGLAHGATGANSPRYNMSDSDYYALMKSLNNEQVAFVYDTMHQLKTSQQPVYRFLSGGAGTGKSYVLRALREMAERFYKSKAGENFQQCWSMTVAPTGKAAFIAGGGTIHSILHVPANQSFTYNRLYHETLNTLRTQIGHIKLWLIDEISMVGSRMLSFIDQRLQEVNNTSSPFGGASVVAFGDFYQLPPVMDGFVFHDMSKSHSRDENYSALAPNLWKELFTMFELTRIMRQQDSKQFAELLNRLREGHHSDSDLEILRSRIITPQSPDYPVSAQHLFKTNSQVEIFNMSVYDSCTEKKCLINSVDSVVGAISEHMTSHVLNMIPTDSRKTMQLPSVLPLAVGCRYEISVNVNVTDGLANGAGGVIKYLQLTSDRPTASGTVWVLFDDSRVGVQTRSDNQSLYRPNINPEWTPIQPLSRQFQVGRSQSNQILRKQFPLRQSAAKTIHRSQGDTVDEVVVDFTSTRRDAHSHYVALSRVRTLQGLFILNLCENKIHISENVKQEMEGLRSTRKLPLSLYLPSDYPPTSFHVTFLNVRSLHGHIDLIRNDHVLSSSDVNMYCESRVKQSDLPHLYHVENYHMFQYSCHTHDNRRSHYGISVYSKPPVLKVSQPVSMTDSTGSVECVLLHVSPRDDVILALACVYRSPRSDLTQFKIAMSHLISQIQSSRSYMAASKHLTVIMGDFNMDLLQSETQSLIETVFPQYRQISSVCTTDYGSLLDHVYTDIPSQFIQCYAAESYFTDHKPLTVAIDLHD